MTTRVKESGARGKEKKGGMSSPSPNATQKRSTNTPKPISSGVSSVPNYLRATSSSSGIPEDRKTQVEGPHLARRKSFDRPPPSSPHGDNKSSALARRKSFDRPLSHSLSSVSSQANGRVVAQGSKPNLPRTKSTLDKPQPSTGRTTGKMMRSISAIGKSSSSISHNQLKPLSKTPLTANSKSQNNTRKQVGGSPSRPIKKGQEITKSNNHEQPSTTEPAETDDITTTNINSPNHTETSNDKIALQDKETIIVADEELKDLKPSEPCSLLVPEDSSDHVDAIEEGDSESADITTVPEKFTKSNESIPIAGDSSPHVEEMKETVPIVEPKFAENDAVPIQEHGEEDDDDEKMLQTCNNQSENCIGYKEEKQEKEEEKDNNVKELGDEEVKERSENNNNNNVVREVKVVQGTKKNDVVSNGVIEETASKLREQRKNKVKALAGAFETVISLQDPK